MTGAETPTLLNPFQNLVAASRQSAALFSNRSKLAAFCRDAATPSSFQRADRHSTVTAIRKGAAVGAIRDTKSKLTTVLSGWGFSQELWKMRSRVG